MAANTIRRSTLLVAGTATAGALALTSAPAAFSASTASATSAASADATALRSARSGATTAATDVITCKARVHLPHYSHHAHAKDKHRVNVTADVKCDKRVASLKIKVRLLKNGKPYKTTGWKSNTGKNKISHNAARRCIKKQKYQGQAWVQVVFPPGYRPPTAATTVKSKVVTIRKCTR